jgi:putative transposase
MPRQVRLEYPSAIYHIMARGNRKGLIFIDDKDRYRFLDTLAEVCGRTGFRVHSYVLMPNHYHLLLETPEANLVAGMHWLQSTYTIRFNLRHKLVGHLFQGRYKAIPIDSEDPLYFRIISEYIHLNPARAGLLDSQKPNLASYFWSSYRAFIGNKPLPGWLARTRVFAATDLADDGVAERRRYRLYLTGKMNEAIGAKTSQQMEEEWRLIRRGWYFGTKLFKAELEEVADYVVTDKQRASFNGSGLAKHDNRVAMEWLEAALDVAEITLEECRELRPSNPLKQAIVWFLRSRTVASGRWIDKRIGVGHVSNISRAMTMYRGIPLDPERREFKKLFLQICKD